MPEQAARTTRHREQVDEAREQHARRSRRRPRPGTAARRPAARRPPSARRTRATARPPAAASAGAATARTRPSSPSSVTRAMPIALNRHRRPRTQRRRSRPSGPARPLAIPGRRTETAKERTATWRPKRPEPKYPPDVTEHLTTEDRVGLLRAMLMMRGIEERAMTLYRQGKVPGSFYDGFGQEAVSAGATWAMAAAGPPVHPAPRPRRPHHPRRRAVAHLRPVHGPRRTASRAAATATCTSATAPRAASAWSRCSRT